MPDPDEAAVVEWRMSVLTDAGYPENEAISLAYSTCDLHDAVLLIRQGCAVATAVEILL